MRPCSQSTRSILVGDGRSNEFERVNQEVEESMRPNREIENRVAVLMVVTKDAVPSPIARGRRRYR